MTQRLVAVVLALSSAIVAKAYAQPVPTASTNAVWGSAGAMIFDAAGTGTSPLFSIGAEHRLSDEFRLFGSIGHIVTNQQSIYIRSSDERTVRIPYYLLDVGATFSPFAGSLVPFASASAGIVIDPRTAAAKEYPSPSVAFSGTAGLGLNYTITERVGARIESRLRYTDPNAFALSSLETLGGISFSF